MGSLSRYSISRYNCNVYIETGTGYANCLKTAIESKCFTKHYSVDISSNFVASAKRHYPFAKIEHGLSTDALEKWLSDNEISQDDHVLFFLDAHFPDADFNGGKYDVKAPNAVPLEQELRIIKKYRSDCKDYIICDDARIYKMDKWQNGATEWLQVPGGMKFVYDIFPDRKISIDLSDEGYIHIDNR